MCIQNPTLGISQTLYNALTKTKPSNRNVAVKSLKHPRLVHVSDRTLFTYNTETPLDSVSGRRRENFLRTCPLQYLHYPIIQDIGTITILLSQARRIKREEWGRDPLDEEINTVTHYEIPSMDIVDKPRIDHLLYLPLYHDTSRLLIAKTKLQIV